MCYAADWSEYFGHHPQDGTGDVLFHLDPLWSDANIDFVGVDDYTALSDWRHARTHLDLEAGHASIYSLPYLQGNVEGGENYDWYYASEADRESQVRTPINDTGYGEHWVFRPKDLRGWWSNQHFDRIGGVRATTPTAWVPESKPIWLTETGCPSVDLGSNQPNLFSDAKSSESALPHGSLGVRDDEMQRRFLQAKLGYWTDPANVPVSSLTGELMIPADRIFVWTWDTRPWPDFPVRESVWADGPAHRLGHWITGRVTASALSEVVAEICRRSGLTDIDVADLFGVVDGYVVELSSTARDALQPLMLAFGFDAFESGGKVMFRMRGGATSLTLQEEGLVAPNGQVGTPLERSRASIGAANDVVRLTYVQSESDFRVGASEARLPGGTRERVAETSLPLSIPGSKAQLLVDRWLAESWRSRDRAGFTLPLSEIAVEPGDTVEIDRIGAIEAYRIERIVYAAGREAEAVRVDAALHVPNVTPERNLETDLASPPGPVTAIFMDLPLAIGGADDHQPRIAVTTDPWTDRMAVYRSQDDDAYDLIATLAKPAVIGTTLDALPGGEPGPVAAGLGACGDPDRCAGNGRPVAGPERREFGGAGVCTRRVGDRAIPRRGFDRARRVSAIDPAAWVARDWRAKCRGDRRRCAVRAARQCRRSPADDAGRARVAKALSRRALAFCTVASQLCSFGRDVFGRWASALRAGTSVGPARCSDGRSGPGLDQDRTLWSR